jgi:hypothetical protein
MKKLTKITLLVLCLVTLFSCVTAYASSGWYPNSYPSLSKNNYCEFISHKKVLVYRNTGCTTPGTCSPAESYSAYIAKGDKCYIYRITSSYIQINYPSRSGRSTGYVKRSDLSDILPTIPCYAFISNGKANTYKNARGEVYGYTEKNDTVYCCEEYLCCCPLWLPIMYTAKSGNRGYKLGWVKSDDYHKIM